MMSQHWSVAVMKVVATTELLEMILLQLDMKNLLFTQRVNTQFKNTIDGSIELQRALFFLPASAITKSGEVAVPVENELLMEDDSKPARNVLIAQITPGTMTHVRLCSKGCGIRNHDEGVDILRMNNLARRKATVCWR